MDAKFSLYGAFSSAYTSLASVATGGYQLASWSTSQICHLGWRATSPLINGTCSVVKHSFTNYILPEIPKRVNQKLLGGTLLGACSVRIVKYLQAPPLSRELEEKIDPETLKSIELFADFLLHTVMQKTPASKGFVELDKEMYIKTITNTLKTMLVHIHDKPEQYTPGSMSFASGIFQLKAKIDRLFNREFLLKFQDAKSLEEKEEIITAAVKTIRDICLPPNLISFSCIVQNKLFEFFEIDSYLRSVLIEYLDWKLKLLQTPTLPPEAKEWELIEPLSGLCSSQIIEIGKQKKIVADFAGKLKCNGNPLKQSLQDALVKEVQKIFAREETKEVFALIIKNVIGRMLHESSGAVSQNGNKWANSVINIQKIVIQHDRDGQEDKEKNKKGITLQLQEILGLSRTSGLIPKSLQGYVDQKFQKACTDQLPHLSSLAEFCQSLLSSAESKKMKKLRESVDDTEALDSFQDFAKFIREKIKEICIAEEKGQFLGTLGAGWVQDEMPKNLILSIKRSFTPNDSSPSSETEQAAACTPLNGESKALAGRLSQMFADLGQCQTPLGMAFWQGVGVQIEEVLAHAILQQQKSLSGENKKGALDLAGAAVDQIFQKITLFFQDKKKHGEIEKRYQFLYSESNPQAEATLKVGPQHDPKFLELFHPLSVAILQVVVGVDQQGELNPLNETGIPLLFTSLIKDRISFLLAWSYSSVNEPVLLHEKYRERLKKVMAKENDDQMVLNAITRFSEKVVLPGFENWLSGQVEYFFKASVKAVCHPDALQLRHHFMHRFIQSLCLQIAVHSLEQKKGEGQPLSMVKIMESLAPGVIRYVESCQKLIKDPGLNKDPSSAQTDLEVQGHAKKMTLELSGVVFGKTFAAKGIPLNLSDSSLICFMAEGYWKNVRDEYIPGFFSNILKKALENRHFSENDVLKYSKTGGKKVKLFAKNIDLKWFVPAIQQMKIPGLDDQHINALYGVVKSLQCNFESVGDIVETCVEVLLYHHLQYFLDHIGLKEIKASGEADNVSEAFILKKTTLIMDRMALELKIFHQQAPIFQWNRLERNTRHASLADQSLLHDIFYDHNMMLDKKERTKKNIERLTASLQEAEKKLQGLHAVELSSIESEMVRTKIQQQKAVGQAQLDLVKNEMLKEKKEYSKCHVKLAKIEKKRLQGVIDPSVEEMQFLRKKRQDLMTAYEKMTHSWEIAQLKKLKDSHPLPKTASDQEPIIDKKITQLRGDRILCIVAKEREWKEELEYYKKILFTNKHEEENKRLFECKIKKQDKLKLLDKSEEIAKLLNERAELEVKPNLDVARIEQISLEIWKLQSEMVRNDAAIRLLRKEIKLAPSDVVELIQALEQKIKKGAVKALEMEIEEINAELRTRESKQIEYRKDYFIKLVKNILKCFGLNSAKDLAVLFGLPEAACEGVWKKLTLEVLPEKLGRLYIYFLNPENLHAIIYDLLDKLLKSNPLNKKGDNSPVKQVNGTVEQGKKVMKLRAEVLASIRLFTKELGRLVPPLIKGLIGNNEYLIEKFGISEATSNILLEKLKDHSIVQLLNHEFTHGNILEYLLKTDNLSQMEDASTEKSHIQQYEQMEKSKKLEKKMIEAVRYFTTTKNTERLMNSARIYCQKKLKRWKVYEDRISDKLPPFLRNAIKNLFRILRNAIKIIVQKTLLVFQKLWKFLSKYTQMIINTKKIKSVNHYLLMKCKQFQMGVFNYFVGKNVRTFIDNLHPDLHENMILMAMNRAVESILPEEPDLSRCKQKPRTKEAAADPYVLPPLSAQEKIAEIKRHAALGHVQIVKENMGILLYHNRPQTWNCDSARQSTIEALRSERGSPSHGGRGDEEDRLGKVAASQNSKFEADRGITSEGNQKAECYEILKILANALARQDINLIDCQIMEALEKIKIDFGPISLKAREVCLEPSTETPEELGAALEKSLGLKEDIEVQFQSLKEEWGEQGANFQLNPENGMKALLYELLLEKMERRLILIDQKKREPIVPVSAPSSVPANETSSKNVQEAAFRSLTLEASSTR